MKELGLYVYGIMNTNEEKIIIDMMGIDDLHPVTSLRIENVHVMMSQVDLQEYGEGEIEKNLEDMVWVQDKVTRHFEIAQKLANIGVTIPMKFGTIYTSPQNVQEFISEHMEQIKEAISYFQDKEEWTLKVYCDRNKFLENNMEDERKEIEGETEKLSKGAAYFLKKKFAAALEEKARNKILKISNEFWNQIREYAEHIVINKNLSKQVSQHTEDMVLNVALLISKEKLDFFIKEFDKEGKKLDKFNMEIEFVGPWPFYHFSNLFIS